jgi:soluble lytic murein transglycosylase-like protein
MQLATFVVARSGAKSQREVRSRLTGAAAATLRSDLTAAHALARLKQPRRSLPPWKIVAPPPPTTLLGYFKSAQSRYGVPWQYLAAIESIETDFGRVVGLSTAGAEGPMQFMPSTWAAYGTGNVHHQRDAILAAARYLVANGAPGDMSGALFHYNPSPDYVTAVRAYATRMTADPRAFYGYYYRQVILAHVGGPLLLPVGFPKLRAVSLARVIG